jgi:hypothetical protein
MSTENTPGEDSQPQGENSQSDQAFNLEDVVSELLPQFEASFEEAPAQQAEPAATGEAQPENPPAQEAAPDKPEEILSPLLAEKARREREARAEIEALKGSKEQAVKDAREALVKELLQDPQGFIAKYGIDNPGDLAMHFYAADLGDDAPDDLKQQIGMNDLDRYKSDVQKEFEALRNEMAQREQMARNQATLDQYSGFLSEVPAELPYLRVEAQHDQQEALKTMAQVADFMYERDGKYPPASAVAQAIEDQIATQAARYKAIGQPQNVEVQPQTVRPVETQAKTLSTDNSGKSAKKAPVGEDELFENALDMFENMFP